MKKQVFYIHGATAFKTYEDFLIYLRTCELRYPTGNWATWWTSSFREDLGDDFEVYTPTMPNKQNAKYNEWKIWFERHFQFLKDNVILVGWSQGGYFLAKYLSENNFPVKIGGLVLIAAPFEDVGSGGDGGDFAFNPDDLKNIAQNIENIYIFHAKDDPIVPFIHAEKYAERLPQAELVTFDDKGHFLIEEFPELIQTVQSL